MFSKVHRPRNHYYDLRQLCGEKADLRELHVALVIAVRRRVPAFSIFETLDWHCRSQFKAELLMLPYDVPPKTSASTYFKRRVPNSERRSDAFLCLGPNDSAIRRTHISADGHDKNLRKQEKISFLTFEADITL